MKKNLLIIAAALMAACHSDPKVQSDSTTTTGFTDSANNKAALKDNGQIVNMKGVNDTLVSSDGSQYVKVEPKSDTTAVAPIVKSSSAKHHHSSKSHEAGSSGAGSSTEQSSSTATTTTSTTSTPEVKKKKGWSKAAKGTVIGAGTGAVAGAIISKKKGLGAVIGAAVGAGGGYIIGRKMDKKDGRVKKEVN